MADAAGAYTASRSDYTTPMTNLHLDDVTGEMVSKVELKRRCKWRQKYGDVRARETVAPPEPVTAGNLNADADEKEPASMSDLKGAEHLWDSAIYYAKLFATVVEEKIWTPWMSWESEDRTTVNEMYEPFQPMSYNYLSRRRKTSRSDEEGSGDSLAHTSGGSLVRVIKERPQSWSILNARTAAWRDRRPLLVPYVGVTEAFKDASRYRHIYSKATDHKRKALRCSIDGSECFARPDSASDRDIITEAFAEERGILVQRGDEDKTLFQLGSGKVVQSVGRALVPLSLFGDGQSAENRWFDVLAKCAAPMILGLNFIRKFKLYTEKKHLLVDCPYSFGNLPALKWIGSPQERINFVADGRSLTAGADTGSDLDLMSLRCARRRGFKIDTSESARSRVMLADETVVETVGQVHVSSVQLSQFDTFGMSFHVLPGLPCDIIFGEEFLDQMDAFNTCDIVHLDQNVIHSLNTLINLGPIQAFLTRKWASKPDDTAQQGHDQAIEDEIYRRNKANRALAKIKDVTRAVAASEAEEVKRRNFDSRHSRCMHCIGAVVGSDPLGE